MPVLEGGGAGRVAMDVASMRALVRQLDGARTSLGAREGSVPDVGPVARPLEAALADLDEYLTTTTSSVSDDLDMLRASLDAAIDAHTDLDASAVVGDA